MLLYHLGYEIIEKPDVRYGRKNADFGQGFYLTAQDEFAGKWAKERKEQQPVLNTYEMDLTGWRFIDSFVMTIGMTIFAIIVRAEGIRSEPM